MEKNLYIIAGCNGAGKTTAAYNILPEIQCKEFVNADEIARGLSPLNVEGVAIQAGRLMLKRIDELLNEGVTFAIETTLSTRSYVKLVTKAQQRGYEVHLLFCWLNSPDVAKLRVEQRVANGGHGIPADTIERRYWRGIRNFFELYCDIVDTWTLVDNRENELYVIATSKEVINHTLYQQIIVSYAR